LRHSLSWSWVAQNFCENILFLRTKQMPCGGNLSLSFVILLR
jgi:hypothetical protein